MAECIVSSATLACVTCLKEKSVDAFPRRSDRSNSYRSQCKECTNARRAKWLKEHPDAQEKYKARKKAAKYRYEVPAEKRAEYNTRYYRKNQPQRAATYRANAARWLKENPDKAAAKKADRRARKLHAQPIWASRFAIAEAYSLARLRTQMTGRPWEVDHIVPLKSPLVCGLHVEHNLAVIPAVENSSKGNRYWPDMP